MKGSVKNFFILTHYLFVGLDENISIVYKINRNYIFIIESVVNSIFKIF